MVITRLENQHAFIFTFSFPLYDVEPQFAHTMQEKHITYSAANSEAACTEVKNVSISDECFSAPLDSIMNKLPLKQIYALSDAYEKSRAALMGALAPRSNFADIISSIVESSKQHL